MSEREQVDRVEVASCRWCGAVRLVALPGLPPPSVSEYFEKVTLHEALCEFWDEGILLGDA